MNKLRGKKKEKKKKMEPKSFKLHLRKKQAQIQMLLKLPYLQCEYANKYTVSLREHFPMLI